MKPYLRFDRFELRAPKTGLGFLAYYDPRYSEDDRGCWARLGVGCLVVFGLLDLGVKFRRRPRRSFP